MTGDGVRRLPALTLNRTREAHAGSAWGHAQQTSNFYLFSHAQIQAQHMSSVLYAPARGSHLS